MSKRKDVESIKMWMLQNLDQVSKLENNSLYQLFSQQQLIFNASISELLRQISLECKDRAELIQSIWNNHVEITTKVVEFYSKENNRQEWDTLTQIKQLHNRYRDELQYSQKVYEDNNLKFHNNKKELETVLQRYRQERKINKKLEKLCTQLKNDKNSINGLYCETSKEYIQLMVNTGKLTEEQESSLLSQYVEASKGYLSRKIDFQQIKQSIKLREKSQKEQELLIDRIVQGKTPHDSEDSGEEDTEVKEMFQKRKIRFEERATQVENNLKVDQETDNDFNKMFMVSKGVQIQMNPKKTNETQTEIEILHQSIQTEPKQLKHQYAQTEMTASKNSEDFEKLKTVYLKKVKVDPSNNRIIEQEGNESEEFSSNQLSIMDNKESRVLRSQEDVNQSPVKFQRSSNKKTSIKKNRASIFSLGIQKQSSVLYAENEDIPLIDEKSDEEDNSSNYLFDSQNKLKAALKKINEYIKFIKVDENIKQKTTQSQINELALQLKSVDQAMEIEEYKNIQLIKDQQTDILIKNQIKINSLADDLNISTDDDDDEQSQVQTPKQMMSQILEGQLNRNKSTSSVSSIMQIKDPFSHHSNVQNLVTEAESKRNKNDKNKQLQQQPSLKNIPLIGGLKQSESQNKINKQGSMTDQGFKPKHLAFQRRQSQIASQIFHVASTPVAAIQINNSQTHISTNFEQKKYQKNKKLLQKLKNLIQANHYLPKININTLNLQNRQKECFKESEVLLIVEQLKQQANRNASTQSESITLKNTVIQVRKLLQVVYSDLLKIIKTGQKLNKPLSILLREYFSQQSVESNTISLSKMRKTLEKCITIPKTYEEIMTFTQLAGINKGSEIDYDQSEFINIYLQMLHYLNEDTHSSHANQLQIITSQLETNTSQIYKYLPSILSDYLPEKTIYDIVMYLLKPYLDAEGEQQQGNIQKRDNLVDIPIPEKAQIPFNEVLQYVMSKLKDYTLQIPKMYNPLYECITLNDSEEIREDQFIFLQKYLGPSEKSKNLEQLYKFRDMSSKQAMDKQIFVGFCNRYQVFDDYKFKHILEGKEFDDLTSFDFETIDKFETAWKSQKIGIQRLLYEIQVYKPIHKRLINVIDSYILLVKKNVSYKKFYKTRSVIAYKLLKMEMRYYLEQQEIKNYYLPENIILLDQICSETLINAELKFIARKQRVLKKGVSVVYPNVFQKNTLNQQDEDDDDEDENDSSFSSNIQYSNQSQNGDAEKKFKSSIVSLKDTPLQQQ